MEPPSELTPNVTFDCPRCGARDSVRLSIPHLAEQPLRLIGFRPYRCRACRRRFYRNWPVPPWAEQVLEEPTIARPVSFLPPAKLVRPNAVSAATQTVPRPLSRTAFRNASPPQAVAAPAPQQMQAAAAPSVRTLPGVRPWLAPAPRPVVKLAVSPRGDNAAAAAQEESGARSLPTSKPSLDDAAAFREAYRIGPSLRFCLGSFGGLLALHFLVGWLEFGPLGAAAMWVNLLSLVAVLSAMLVYVYLRRTLRSTAGAAVASAALVLGWCVLFFASEVVLGWFVVPGVHGFAGDVALFRAQAPWIWMTYPVLLAAGAAGCVTYLVRGNKPTGSETKQIPAE